MWKLNLYGTAVTRTNDDGSYESRLIIAIPEDELLSALPADPVIVPIPSMTPRQVRLVLTQAGLRAQVEAAVALADQDTKDTWEFSTVIDRSNPLLVAMATSLGMTETQLDELFILGSTL